jgi:hypothetical protein
LIDFLQQRFNKADIKFTEHELFGGGPLAKPNQQSREMFLFDNQMLVNVLFLCVMLNFSEKIVNIVHLQVGITLLARLLELYKSVYDGDHHKLHYPHS